MYNLWLKTLEILNESAIYLLLGFTLAGFLHVLLRRFPRLTEPLIRKGNGPVFLAALIGLPMPLCSCSVLPAALAIRRQGASKGATASFLVSVPETDIVSILITFALLGPAMAVFRPLAAVVTALTAGLTVNWVDGQKETRVQAPTENSRKAAVLNGSCCDDPGGEAGAAKRNWLKEAFHFGFVEVFDDIILQLLIGILIAGILAAWIPTTELAAITSNSFVTYVMMLAIGVPIYVCATASTPIAVGLIAGGLSPGAALVFLLAGPATNVATLLVLRKQFGRASMTAYLASILLVSVLMGVVLDRLVGANFTLPLGGNNLRTETVSTLQFSATMLLALLVAISFWRTKVQRRMSSR